jgi:NDP-sugar pyrophosphorylase family protein
MRAVILAAGEGARLRPLTHRQPKPMLRVANQPIAAYAVEALVANGIADITIVAGYQRERLQTYFGDGARSGARITYVFQDLLLGTAHALAQVPFQGEAVLAMGGDNVVDARLVKDLLAAKGDLRLVVHRSEQPSKYGVVTLDKDRVARIEEKPRDFQSEIVNTGVYHLPKGFHALLAERVRRGIGGVSHVLQDLLAAGTPVQAVSTEGLWRDAVYPWDLLPLNDLLVRRATSGAVALGQSSTVRPTASVQAPALVGEGCLLDSGVVLGPTSTIGRNVTIGANSVVENCILGDDVRIGPGSIVRNAILAEGVQAGARFTALSGPCEFRAEDGWHALEDFGCVVGADARLGGNVTVDPGIAVGAGAQVGHGAWVRRNVAPGAVLQG